MHLSICLSTLHLLTTICRHYGNKLWGHRYQKRLRWHSKGTHSLVGERQICHTYIHPTKARVSSVSQVWRNAAQQVTWTNQRKKVMLAASPEEWVGTLGVEKRRSIARQIQQQINIQKARQRPWRGRWESQFIEQINLGTGDTGGQIILCCGSYSVHAGWLATPPASTRRMPGVSSLAVMTQSISRYGHVFLSSSSHWECRQMGKRVCTWERGREKEELACRLKQHREVVGF